MLLRVACQALAIFVVSGFFIAAEAYNRPLGTPCAKNGDCASGHCADGRFCAPVNRSGRPGDYCHHENHCSPGMYCDCPSGGGGFCKNWRSRSGGGQCQFNRKVGEPARPTAGMNCRAPGCDFGLHCADGRVCAPVDRTGRPGQYCHHDNHCRSRNCVCPSGKSFGFCARWEGWSESLRLRMVRGRSAFYCR